MLGLAMIFRLLRLTYGALLIALLFVPFAVFHTMAEPYVAGALWGFMLPAGWVAAASGVALILYPRSTQLKRLGFGYLLMLSGVFMLLSVLLFPRGLSISLFYGTNAIADLDYSIFTGAVFWLSLLNIVAGLAIRVSGLAHYMNKT